MLVLFSVFFCTRLHFNYDFERYFPQNDPALPFFKKFRATFGFDNEFVLVGIENRKGIFKKDFLRKIDMLTKAFSRLKYIKEVQSPTNLKWVGMEGIGMQQISLLHFRDSSLYRMDSVRIFNSAHFKNTFFSEDGKSVSILLKSEDGLSKKKCDSLSEKILGTTLNIFKDADVHFAGRIFAQKQYIQMLESQFFFFVFLSLGIIALLLYWAYRSIGGVLLPLLLIILSLLLTFGIMGMFALPIDLMTILIPSMIFVAGMSDVVHYYTRYREDFQNGRTHEEIVLVLQRDVAWPTFVTLVSTMAGFLSLCYTSVQPIRLFGIFTSIGIAIAYAMTFTFLPFMLQQFPPAAGGGRKLKWLEKSMHVLLKRIVRAGPSIAIITSILIVLSLFGVSRLKVNQALLEDIPSNTRIKNDVAFFEKSFGGIRPFELSIEILRSGDKVWNAENILQIEQCENFISLIYHPGFLAGPGSLLKATEQMYSGSYSLPLDSLDLQRDICLLQKNRHARPVLSIVREDGCQARISAKVRDLGSHKMDSCNALLTTFIKHHTDTSRIRCRLTGTANLIDLNNKSMVDNTLKGLLTGIGVLVFLTIILQRSLKMIPVFLIPNLIPLLLMAGIMGWFHVELKSTTAIFFSIAFGIATDDTIHFVSRYSLEIRKGRSPLRAFHTTYLDTGKAVFLTTMILIGGFISLIFSDFGSVSYFGLLLTLTLWVALVSEIFLLPILLFWAFRRKESKSKIKSY